MRSNEIRNNENKMKNNLTLTDTICNSGDVIQSVDL